MKKMENNKMRISDEDKKKEGEEENGMKKTGATITKPSTHHLHPHFH